MGVGQKIKMGLKSDAFRFFEARYDTQLKKRPPKAPLSKKLHFDLLDHKVDSLSIILGPKF